MSWGSRKYFSSLNIPSSSNSCWQESARFPDDDPPAAPAPCGSKGPRGPLLLEKLRERYPDGRNGVAVMMKTNSPRRGGTKRWTIAYSRTRIEWNASEEGKNWAWQGEGMRLSREGGRNTVTFTHMSKPRAARTGPPGKPIVPSGCTGPQGTRLLEALKRCYPDGRNGVAFIQESKYHRRPYYAIRGTPYCRWLAADNGMSWAWQGRGMQYSVYRRWITVNFPTPPEKITNIISVPRISVPSGYRGPHGQILLEKLKERFPNGRTGVVVMTALDSKGGAKSWKIFYSRSQFGWDATALPGKSWAWQGEGMQVSCTGGRNVVTFSRRCT